LISRTIIERAREKARRHGMELDEYLVELLTSDMDPRDRARDYILVARDLLEQAREELRRGDVRQAAEKLWGAAALAVKAYASWREGKRLTSHRELWEYSKKLIDELGEWVRDAWMSANGMHTCFYENWCSEEDVRDALKRIERLVREVYERVVGLGEG